MQDGAMTDGWRVLAVQRLVVSEGLDARRLAIRAGWPEDRVAAVLDGRMDLDADAAAELFACFAVDLQLAPWAPEVADAVVDARSLSPAARFDQAVRMARFFAEVGPTSPSTGSRATG